MDQLAEEELTGIPLLSKVMCYYFLIFQFTCLSLPLASPSGLPFPCTCLPTAPVPGFSGRLEGTGTNNYEGANSLFHTLYPSLIYRGGGGVGKVTYPRSQPASENPGVQTPPSGLRPQLGTLSLSSLAPKSFLYSIFPTSSYSTPSLIYHALIIL